MMKHEFESLYGHKVGWPRWKQIEDAYMGTDETKQDFVARLLAKNEEKNRLRNEMNPRFPRREARRLLLNPLSEEDNICVAWRGRNQDYPSVWNDAVGVFHGREDRAVLEQFAHEMRKLLCKDLPTNPCHKM